MHNVLLSKLGSIFSICIEEAWDDTDSEVKIKGVEWKFTFYNEVSFHRYPPSLKKRLMCAYNLSSS